MQIDSMPGFLSLDTKGREAYLSQVGSFSAEERRIFHRLVAIWAPVISYRTTVSIVSSDSATGQNDLHSLMEKLRIARCGVLVTSLKDGEREPQGIVIADQDSQTFHARYLDERMLDVAMDLRKPLPTLEGLKEENVLVPKGLAVTPSPEDLVLIHAGSGEVEPEVIAIPAGGMEFLANKSSIKRFVTLALARMQWIMQNATLLAYFSQKRNVSLMELKGSIETRSPEFWLDFCAGVLVARDPLRQQRKVVLDVQFFALAEFLGTFLDAQKVESLRRRKAEEERRVDMQALVESLRATAGMRKSEEDFSALLMGCKERYPDSFEAFKQEFEQTFLVPPPRKTLPVVVHVGKSWIHQENLHPLFMLRLEEMGKELFGMYVQKMERYVKYRRDEDGTPFYSMVNFDSDIQEHVAARDPLLWELLQRPGLVAEAVIHSVKKHREIRSADDIRAHLAPFFLPERITYRPLTDLFGLDARNIYRYAFVRLSIFRQIIMKITGRDDMMIRRFKELEDGFREDAPVAGEGRKERRREQRLDAPGAGAARNRKKSDERNSPRPTSRATPSPPPQKKHSYSSAEQDNAWKAFQDQILR